MKDVAIIVTIAFWTIIANIYIAGVIQQTLEWGPDWDNLKPWEWV